MKKTILILSLFVSFFPLFTSAEVDSIGNSFGANFQERVSDAVSVFSKQSRERIQERVTERKEEVKEKREALQEVFSGFSDGAQERLNNFQNGIEEMNVKFSKRYYNYLDNASNSIENIADKLPEEALSEETQKKLEELSNHKEKMYELVEDQFLEDYIIEADSIQDVAGQFQNKIQELKRNHSDIQEEVVRKTRELRVQLMRTLVTDFNDYLGEEDEDTDGVKDMAGTKEVVKTEEKEEVNTENYLGEKEEDTDEEGEEDNKEDEEDKDKDKDKDENKDDEEVIEDYTIKVNSIQEFKNKIQEVRKKIIRRTSKKQ
ncbi:MAG: hypothetical protein U9P61_01565 [Patescibacteria group bacterium]|nr:hypothetical protein [Patescibacteria group bacterium]